MFFLLLVCWEMVHKYFSMIWRVSDGYPPSSVFMIWIEIWRRILLFDMALDVMNCMCGLSICGGSYLRISHLHIVYIVVLPGCGFHGGDETVIGSSCLHGMCPVLVGRHLCNNFYNVILVRVRGRYCFFLKVYGFLRWCFIDILKSPLIPLQRCHILFFLLCC